jgi:hypothetical protein
MNVKKPSLAKPAFPKESAANQALAQQQSKSDQSSAVGTPGKNGVILHVAGCSGNHLGKC